MNELPPHPSARYRGLIQLLRTAEALWQGSRIFFARWDLSPSQFNVLNLLQEAPAGMSQTDLSRTLLMHRSNVTGLVDRLEERGLVKRLEMAGDRRSYRVVLTVAGTRQMREILPLYLRAVEEVWGGTEGGQVGALAATLKRLGANAHQMAAHFKH
jgi:DNA-binding MarR family transcriptional regulator